MLISFIVPVFNRENLLDECMQSLLTHLRQDYEIILVDDASTDSSPALCDGYAARYDQVHVIHLPENHGPGYARNRGMERAQGKWLFFLDSDDLICTENLERILYEIEKMPPSVDLIGIDVIDEWGGVRWDFPFFTETEVLDTTDYLQKYPMRLHMPLWNFLFRRSYIAENGLHLPDLYAHEDIAFLLDAFRQAKQVGSIPGYFYCYRRGVSENSLATKHHGSYPIRPYEPYIAALCRDIARWEAAGDQIRTEIYTQLLVKCALNIVHVLAEKETPCRHPLCIRPLTEHAVLSAGVAQYLTDILFESLPQYEGLRCFLAPANKISRILADYLALYGCEVVGMIDNHAPAVTTPQGRSIPVYPREEAAAVCGDHPILITNNWGVGAKLEKYFHIHGLTTLPWTLNREEI